MGLFGATFLLPQYLQTLRGLGPSTAGLLLMPQGLAAIAGTIVAGILYNRINPRILVIFGAIAVTFDTYFLGTWSTLTSAFILLVPLLILRGLALPLLTQTTNTIALNEVSNDGLAGANTVLNVTRSVISSLALAVLINILQAKRLVHQTTLAHVGTLRHAIQQQAQALAYQDVYLITAIVTVPLIFLPLLLRSQLKKTAPKAAERPATASASEKIIGTQG